MLDVRFVPLPRPERLPLQRSAFKSNYTKTLDLLEYELGHLKAKDITIQAGFAKAQIRNDGWPKGGTRPDHPAVVVSFISNGKQLSFAASRYLSYEENLRAVASSLEALRAVDRYGVSGSGEQYAGWAQVAAPGQSESLHELAIWLAGVSTFPKDFILADSDTAQRAYRAAAMKLHPDKGGSREEWAQLQRAKEQLDAHFAGGAK